MYSRTDTVLGFTKSTVPACSTVHVPGNVSIKTVPGLYQHVAPELTYTSKNGAFFGWGPVPMPHYSAVE